MQCRQPAQVAPAQVLHFPVAQRHTAWEVVQLSNPCLSSTACLPEEDVHGAVACALELLEQRPILHSAHSTAQYSAYSTAQFSKAAKHSTAQSSTRFTPDSQNQNG